MISVLTVVLPIFALIFAGWTARRIGVLGEHASEELNRFVVNLALPALLFDIVARARWSDLLQPGFVAAFGLAAGGVFAATVWTGLARGRHLADAAIDGLNGGYGNVGFMGFPLVLAALGPVGLAPTLVATILTVCVLFAIALVLVETGLQAERKPLHLAAKVSRSLARNPLLVAPASGAIVLALGCGLPPPVDSFMKLLGGAASPCALVGLGLFLAEKRQASTPSNVVVGTLVILKLLVQPLLTWLLAEWVFRLPAGLTHAAVLLAALPTGTGPFMVAEFYRREAGVTSRVILLSTIGALATITLYLGLVR